MTNADGRQYNHDQWLAGANQRIGDASQRVAALLKQRAEEGRLHAQRLAEEAERKRQEEIETERRYDQLATEQKRQARVAYFSQHPYASEESFAAYWKRVKPDRAALDEGEIQRAMEDMARLGFGRL
jgi:hypothetical protein